LPVPILFFYFADIKVTDLDLGYFDDFLEIEFLALIFLCFAIVGMMNAFNLIDGINGQLSSYLVSIIIALKVIENISGAGLPLSDEFRYFTNILLGALAGFFLLNLFGKIFLGDAGAYFLGSIVCFGLIEAQQSNNLSPWAVMLILAYPFTDLIFSVLRRRFITGGDAMQPDAEHLHHVIYKRFETIQFRHDRARHFFTIVFLTIFNFPYIASAVYFSDNTAALISIFIVYVLSYLLIYFSLSPRFLLSNDKK
jgi:UDP-N-acetylmuramyl pentapeptide phosphotransferase/UDP-N-acetylglucosamine-1-phosphate transferase